jgi:hypothetical protein
MSDCPSVCPFHMSHSNLRTPWPIHFKFHRVIGIDGLTVCILYGEISNFYSRVMGLYSSNCRRFLVCHAVNWEPLRQFFLSNKFWLSVLSVLWLYDCSPLYQCITYRHDITEILLKVALNSIKPTNSLYTSNWPFLWYIYVMKMKETDRCVLSESVNLSNPS